MNFRDHWVEREDGTQFVFTVEMQRKLSLAGLPVEPAYLSELGQSAPAARSARPAPAAKGPDIEGPETVQIDPQTGKYIGRIKWYNDKKGYGFIMRGAGEEIFFHKSGSSNDTIEFAEGMWILYDVEETTKGPEATDVEPFDYQGAD